MDMNEIKEIFFQECEEQLAELESGLLRINDGDSDPETVNAVFRAVHSIKGGAGAFGLDELVAFAHVFETTLDCVRSNKLQTSSDLLKVMLKSADVLADLTAASRDGGSIDKSRTSVLVKELEAFAKGTPLPVAAPAAEPAKQEAPAAAAPEPAEDSGFQPVPFSFDDFGDEDDAASPVEAGGGGRSVFTVRFKPRSDLYAKGNEAVLLLRDLAKVGDLQVRCETDTLPPIDQLDPEGAYFSWLIRVETDKDEDAIRHVFEFAEWDCMFEVTPGADEEAFAAQTVLGEDQPMAPVPFDLSMLDDEPAMPVAAAEPAVVVSMPAPAVAEPAANPAEDAPLAPPSLPRAEKAIAAEAEKKDATVAAVPAAPQTIRVDLDRVDRLINLVGELVINQAMLAQSVVENETGGSSAINLGLEELQQLTREIQDSVMAIRAQPVKPVFQRMGRIVREIADMTGKNVRLVTEGENTEVDKTVIDKLAEPLTHMIRNAVDHGLETPEKRLALGKNAEGVLRLTAKHRSGRIVIEIADDGAGINRERVRSKAIENGLIAPDSNLSDEEIDNLIFHPGFSTAEKLSDISGRGVGMDVVKRSIQQLGGRISITSKPGKGSVFTMSLPLTLAVLDGMVVTVANQTLVVPLTAIVETLQPEKKDIHAFGPTQRLIAIRDTFCPLIDVGHILNFRPDLANPIDGVALLVESEGGGQRALMVDAIQGQRQVVIKSLEANYTNVPGIAAATILGDGRVALILDVDAVVTASRGHALSSEMTLSATG
ncbi:MAG: chemotaxis protein CheA [Hoeflea sp.]|uniref:chemotaxis protein CheA n=1 Tax=Hoeflea sp. TaxID=1940281 RepID=UPI001DD90CDF|nr:chemotaxis protein CheA [Hoeflea sp.]MBU4531149.1 chemotaxis protein CheA [Alphaproteobacteria bacterium]MBU4545789.1 chemotaxis protein CheA [Alphaproteobacteria bacterium]MBU4550758.1 chemotaxis protein CheA [Alphaproteobacteria bacterium]MBV1724426.1 chemotaxis protein CheA [Hoeflea sp.]MBV1760446.1 chemotaxis protein CheA [Hoeflea sp.]